MEEAELSFLEIIAEPESGSVIKDEFDEFGNLRITFKEKYSETTQVESVVVGEPPDTLVTHKERVATIVSVEPERDYGVSYSFSKNVLTITGPYTKAFVRTIRYLDNNNNDANATDFVSLPESYNSLYKYVIFPQHEISTVFKVRFVDIIGVQHIINYVVRVQHKWQITNPILVKYVKKGKF